MKHKDHHSGSSSSVNHNDTDAPFYEKGWFLFLMTILFGVVYTISFIVNKTIAAAKITKFNTTLELGFDDLRFISDAIVKGFAKYGLLSVILFLLFVLIVAFIVRFIGNLVRLNKLNLVNALSILIPNLLLLWFAIQLVFIENRFAPIVIALILYVGYPLLYSTIIMCVIALLLAVISIIKKVKE